MSVCAADGASKRMKNESAEALRDDTTLISTHLPFVEELFNHIFLCVDDAGQRGKKHLFYLWCVNLQSSYSSFVVDIE